jgi:signal transduction histidine kinase
MKGTAKAEKKAKKHRKKSSVSAILFRSIATVFVIGIAIVVIADSRMVNYVYLLKTGFDLWTSADIIESAYNDPSKFYETLREVELNNDISVEIFGPADNIVYTTSYNGPYIPLPFSENDTIGDQYRRRFKITDSGFQNTGFHFDLREDGSGRVKREYLVFVRDLRNGGRLELYKLKNELDDVARIGIIFISSLSTIMVTLMLFVIARLIKRFTDPLKEMCRITDNMSKLDFSQKVGEMRGEEIDRLARSINAMSDSLNEALTDLQAKNQKLQDDIEKEHTLDHLRKIFLTGVSHELKTPIAIIQGYSEGLSVFAREDADMAIEYANIIKSEAERMNQMIMKLIEIIKYDSGEYVPNYESFNVYELIDDWFVRSKAQLADKGVFIINEIPRDVTGYGDIIILGSVVNNYLSNALSHVEDLGEGRIIRANLEDRGDIWRIYLFNSGQHITDKDIGKIWTSFYRADKAMSRAAGRSGLGLALVAAIQKLHHMEYGVENVQGGVRFWFDVRKPGIEPKQLSE